MSVKRKLVLIGSALTVLATFLPWYSDIDRFNVGDTFLGISGPLYLLGLVTLVAAGGSVLILTMKLTGRKKPQILSDEGHYHLINSVIVLGMLLLASSIYLHPKFGISLADKSLGIGMIFAFAGAIVSGIGAWMSKDERAELADTITIDTPIFEHEPNMIQNREPRDLGGREQTVEEMMRAHNHTNEIR